MVALFIIFIFSIIVSYIIYNKLVNDSGLDSYSILDDLEILCKKWNLKYERDGNNMVIIRKKSDSFFTVIEK